MGYTTDFSGAFRLDRPLEPEHATYLREFSRTRRMKRDPAVASGLPDPVRVAAGLPIGEEGGYFVGAGGFAGQEHDASVMDYNSPPAGQPALWCQWVPNDESTNFDDDAEAGTAIGWDGGEKFYNYVEWLEYLIAHFLAPWGYTLNGEVRWRGEDFDDLGKIITEGNVVRLLSVDF